MDIDRFIADCRAAADDADPQGAIHDVLARAVAEPAAVRRALGEPAAAGLGVLYRSDSLTIVNATWTPHMTLMPHNHGMWALIGLYAGREDNILWRRTPGRIEAHGARALFAGDTVALPADAIHSVSNPLGRFAGGIHIYGGDFLGHERRQWDAETLVEQRSDGAVISAMFERENARLER